MNSFRLLSDDKEAQYAMFSTTEHRTMQQADDITEPVYISSGFPVGRGVEYNMHVSNAKRGSPSLS